jgi:hypothetical protein
MIGSLNPKGLPSWLRVIGQVVGANVEGTRSERYLLCAKKMGAQSSIVHFERKLDFTLVILTVAYRSDFSKVTRVEKIE